MRRKVVVSLAALALIALVAVLGRASGQRVGWQPSVAPAGESEAAETPGSLSGQLLSGDDTLSRAELLRAANQAEDVPSAGGSWQYAGANNIGGRVTDVVVDPAHANTMYISSAGGGVWKSTDAGLTYTPSWPTDDPQAIGSLARGSDGTLWAGTGEANAVRRRNHLRRRRRLQVDRRGRHLAEHRAWRTRGMIGRIAVDPADPDVVFVAAAGSIYSTGGKRGLYRTVDGGEDWTRPAPDLDAAPFTGGVDVAIDPVNPNRVFAIAVGPSPHLVSRALRRHRLGPVRDGQRWKFRRRM